MSPWVAEKFPSSCISNQINQSCKIFGHFLWLLDAAEPVDFSRTELGKHPSEAPSSDPKHPKLTPGSGGASTQPTSEQQQLQMCLMQQGYSTDDYSDLEADSEDEDNSSDVDIVGDSKLYQLT